MRCEAGVSVGDHLIRESEPFVDVFKVEFGYSFSRDGGVTRNEYGCTGASMIHNRQDCIESVAFRELGD